MVETNKIILGDCIEELKKIPDNSVDAIITDPPYGLGFMNKEWDNPDKERELIERERRRSEQRKADGKSPTTAPFSQSVRPGLAIKGAEETQWYQKWTEEWAKESLRVLKPGGYLLSFCATRMYHRMTCGIEDAGFEIRDCIMWIYGSGFPKSLNIGKQIDKMQGNEREIIGLSKNERELDNVEAGFFKQDEFGGRRNTELEITKGSSEWEGWGTALKPACEPIVVARKPLSEKNVALNVLKWGTGGINIDESRIEHNEDTTKASFRPAKQNVYSLGFKQHDNQFPEYNSQGRFPANIIFDEESAKMLDEQSGISKSSDTKRNRETLGSFGMPNDLTPEYSDKGGASRFFYVAKASKSERNFGCEELEEQTNSNGDKWSDIDRRDGKIPLVRKNNHPTVKPIKLIEYLIKLVSREGSVVLDPFLGSGTTAIACLKTNRNFIGIEKEPDYIKIAEARIKPYLEQGKLT